jgi:hypothetical protein
MQIFCKECGTRLRKHHKITPKAAATLRLPRDQLEWLAQESEAIGKPMSVIVAEAISRYMTHDAYLLEQVRALIREELDR